MTLLSLGALTINGYRLWTGDDDTPATVVSGALLEAEEVLGEHLRRELAFEERVDEVCRIWPDGRIYPKAWPLVTADLTIEGRALLGATPDVATFVGYFPDDPPRRATVTYTGGFDDGTNSTRLPFTLAHAIYDLTRALAVDAPALLVGATSASVGDVSVTRGVSGDGQAEALVPGIASRVKRYANRWAA